MTTTIADDDEALVDPVGLIVRLVGEIERHLDPARVQNVVCSVTRGRAGRRRLAQALRDDPSLLRTGQPPAPFCVAKLLMALHQAGAQDVALPRCGQCGRPMAYVSSRRAGQWGCSPCFDRPATCAGCGLLRRVNSRDRHGQPRCPDCPDADGDPLADLVELATGLDPGLSAHTVLTAVGRATGRPAGQCRLAWAVLARPDLLTGAGYDAPAPAVLRFIDELVAAGATKVIPPACPRCHKVKALSKLLDGKRTCRNCFARHAAVPCGRCGALREPAARDRDGKPLCPNCLVNDPANHEPCVGCRRRTRVATRTADGPRCQSCMPQQILVCAICDRTAAGDISRATGKPWCRRCQQKWVTCCGCGTIAQIRGGTLSSPLCARCLNPDPDFWGRCPTCEQTWQLSPIPCLRCTLTQRTSILLGERADLEPLRQALAQVERPDTAMAWLARPKVARLLATLGDESRPLSHDLLDEMPDGKTLAHLRSVLVATGALSARDERLAALERWITTTVRARNDPGERQILHGYGVWHHLRRLRRRLGEDHTTRLQDLNVRCHLTAAANLLDWIASRGHALADCTQADLDTWAAAEHSYRDETAHFVRWTITHRYTTGLTFGAIRWEGPKGPHDTEKRWADAHRLLHDNTLKTPDRVAGLLLLLYAQRIATITQLTTDDVHDNGDTVTITFGRVPVALPDPLAALVRELTATRKGSAIIAARDAKPWLFPGGRPGHPIGDDRLGQRLQQIGLKPRQDRSTALFALATELPAAILARTLGINIKVAVAWQQAASGDWTNYAADVSRRTTNNGQ